MGGSNHGRDSLIGIIEGGEDLAEAKWVTAGCRSGIRGCFTGSSKLQHACETDSSEVDALLTHAGRSKIHALTGLGISPHLPSCAKKGQSHLSSAGLLPTVQVVLWREDAGHARIHLPTRLVDALGSGSRSTVPQRPSSPTQPGRARRQSQRLIFCLCAVSPLSCSEASETGRSSFINQQNFMLQMPQTTEPTNHPPSQPPNQPTTPPTDRPTDRSTHQSTKFT